MANVLEIVIKGRDAGGTRAVDNLTNSMRKAETQGGRMGRAFGGLSGVLGGALKVGLGAGIAGMAGLTAAIGGGVAKAMTLEQTIADTAAVMGKSTEEIKPLKALIEDLGIDPMLKVTAGEAGQAINMLARNGLSMDQILQGAAKSTVLLANATDADFGTAADIATDTMSLFNIEADDMMSAVNGITSVVNNSKFGIDDYALALAQGGGVAATVGVEFADFNTSIAAISPLFASGSDAGTSFKVMLQRLVPSGKPAMKTMKELGIITADGSNQFFDASGNMKGMNEIAGILQTALGGLSDEQKNAALSTMFGTDAMRAAAGMAEIGKQGFEQLQAQMGNTSATDAATTRMGTLAGQMDILQGIIDALWMKIGDAFIPVITKLAQHATVFVDQHGDKMVAMFSDLAIKIGNLIVQIPSFIAQVRQTWQTISQAIEPIASVVRNFVSWQDVLIAVGGVLTVAAIPAIVSFVAAAAPIVALFAGIVAATAGLRRAWESDFWGLRTAITGFINDTNKLDTIKSTLSGWGSSIKAGIDSAKTSIIVNGSSLINTTKSVLSSEQFKGIANTAFAGMTLGLSLAFPNISTSLRGHMSTLMNNVKDGWSKGGLRGAAEAGIKGLVDGFNFEMDHFKRHVAAVAGVLVQKIKDNWSASALKGIAKDAIWGLINGFNEMWDIAMNKVSSLGEGMTNRLKSVLGISSPSKVFMGLGQEVINGLTAGLASNQPQIAVQSIASDMTSPTSGFNSGLASNTSTTTTNNNNNGTNVFYVTVNANGDGRSIAEQIMNLSSQYEQGLAAA